MVSLAKFLLALYYVAFSLVVLFGSLIWLVASGAFVVFALAGALGIVGTWWGAVRALEAGDLAVGGAAIVGGGFLGGAAASSLAALGGGVSTAELFRFGIPFFGGVSIVSGACLVVAGALSALRSGGDPRAHRVARG